MKINFYQTVGTHKNNLDSKWINKQVQPVKKVYFPFYVEVQIKEDEMGRSCDMRGEKNNACWVLVEKPEEKKSLRRSRHRWEDSIGSVFNGIGGH